jgi:hypothetical protein
MVKKKKREKKREEKKKQAKMKKKKQGNNFIKVYTFRDEVDFFIKDLHLQIINN